MIRRDTLTTLSLVCLLSWSCLTGLLMGGDSLNQSGETIVVIGCIKEVFNEPNPLSFSITSIFDAEEWSFTVPPNSALPDIGGMVAVSCHATTSGFVVDYLQPL